MKYTKGEWIIDNTGTAIFVGERLIANCGGWQLSQHEPESLSQNKTNALLIAAAPAMYEALLDFTYAYRRGLQVEQARAYNKAMKALAKAEKK